MHRLNLICPSRSILYSPLPCSVQRGLLLSLLAFGWLEPIGTPVKNQRAEEREVRVILSTTPPPPWPSCLTPALEPPCPSAVSQGSNCPRVPLTLSAFLSASSYCFTVFCCFSQPSPQEQSLYTDSCSPTSLPPPNWDSDSVSLGRAWEVISHRLSGDTKPWGTVPWFNSLHVLSTSCLLILEHSSPTEDSAMVEMLYNILHPPVG